VEKYGGAREATWDNIIRRMRFACWISKATHTHTRKCMYYLLLFHGKSVFANAPRCCFVRTLLLFFNLEVNFETSFSLNMHSVKLETDGKSAGASK
jgi:hypothetical protein